MKEITKEQEERLLLYATYMVLYVNDTACFSIQQLSKAVSTKDKESKKIYGALLKRTKSYLHRLDTTIGGTIDYYCDYCTTMDEICNDSYFTFKSSLKDAYKEANIENYEYLSNVETMRSMVELSVEASKRVIENIKTTTPKAAYLENFLLVDLVRVANNFADWSYRKVPKGVRVDFNEESEVMRNFAKLSTCLIDFYSFDKAYRKAIELEQERKKKEK